MMFPPNPVGSVGYHYGRGLEVVTWGYWIAPAIPFVPGLDRQRFSLKILRSKTLALKVRRKVEHKGSIRRSVSQSLPTKRKEEFELKVRRVVRKKLEV